jgi:Arc/MetJ-type ribon-helix-helix transcriptional regulator
MMDRITFRLPDRQLARIDRLVESGKYPSRSEAIRAYIRDGVQADETAGQAAPVAPGDD